MASYLQSAQLWQPNSTTREDFEVSFKLHTKTVAIGRFTEISRNRVSQVVEKENLELERSSKITITGSYGNETTRAHRCPFYAKNFPHHAADQRGAAKRWERTKGNAFLWTLRNVSREKENNGKLSVQLRRWQGQKDRERKKLGAKRKKMEWKKVLKKILDLGMWRILQSSLFSFHGLFLLFEK